MNNILDKKISKQNLLFIAFVTSLLIILVLVFILFTSMFRSNVKELKREEFIQKQTPSK